MRYTYYIHHTYNIYLHTTLPGTMAWYQSTTVHPYRTRVPGTSFWPGTVPRIIESYHSHRYTGTYYIYCTWYGYQFFFIISYTQHLGDVRGGSPAYAPLRCNACSPCLYCWLLVHPNLSLTTLIACMAFNVSNQSQHQYPFQSFNRTQTSAFLC